MALVMVWLRLSTSRQLPWYKNSSYQSKDIAHVQKALAQRMADKVRRPLWQQCISNYFVPSPSLDLDVCSLKELTPSC